MSAIAPAGVVLPFAGPASMIPEGWMLCDGQAVSREQYASLFQVIGTLHGSGDGDSTFNLPDYRGRFLRGTDSSAGRDPDAMTRGAANPGGATGDSVGSVQGWATSRPRTEFKTNATGSHTHGIVGYAHLAQGATSGGVLAGFAPLNQILEYPAGDHAHSIATGGDSETRPVNASVNFIIKL